MINGVPEDFEEAVNFLISQQIDTQSEYFHHGDGMSMRNDWGLWGNETPIAKWFTAKELFHGDDRSGILQDCIKAKLNGEVFNVDARIKYYQEWWPKQYGKEYTLERQRENFFKYNKDEE